MLVGWRKIDRRGVQECDSSKRLDEQINEAKTRTQEEEPRSKAPRRKHRTQRKKQAHTFDVNGFIESLFIQPHTDTGTATRRLFSVHHVPPPHLRHPPQRPGGREATRAGGPVVLEKRDNQMCTPLLFATFRCQPAIAHWIIKHRGQHNLDTHDIHGQTALHHREEQSNKTQNTQAPIESTVRVLLSFLFQASSFTHAPIMYKSPLPPLLAFNLFIQRPLPQRCRSPPRPCTGRWRRCSGRGSGSMRACWAGGACGGEPNCGSGSG